MNPTPLYLTIAAAAIYVISKLGLAVGGFAVLITGIAIGFSFKTLKRMYELHKAKARFEDVFVVTNHPKTDEEVVLDDEYLDGLIVNVPFADAYETGQHIEGLLRDAPNKSFVDESLTDEEGLRVFLIIWRDAGHPAEEWEEFKGERVAREIKARLSVRHPHLMKANPVWYMKNSNGQRIKKKAVT